MSFKTFLKKFKFIVKLRDNYIYKKNFKDKIQFTNRSNNSKFLCYILAGYKDFLWDIVFKRIKTFVPPEFDVCIVSSGKYDAKLEEIAKQNNWSYLSTKTNNVCLAQNIVISKFENAKYIFKLDEDIFVTKNYFTKLLECYKFAQNSDYVPGIVSPIINVNGYAHVLVLKKYGLKNAFEQRFGKAKHNAENDAPIVANPETAKYMWGIGGGAPQIDIMNNDFNKDALSFDACPIRLSIGAIFFTRELWQNMKHFKVKNRKQTGLGSDEDDILTYCMLTSKPTLVCKNSVVGHLSFGPQNKEMKECFLKNKERFEIDNGRKT